MTELEKALKQLRQILKKEYPYYHYNHGDVWVNYWNLVWCIEESDSP